MPARAIPVRCSLFSNRVIVTTFFGLSRSAVPFNGGDEDPGRGRLATGRIYVVASRLLLFCDFTFPRGAPVYVASADPKACSTPNVPRHYMAGGGAFCARGSFDLCVRPPGT